MTNIRRHAKWAAWIAAAGLAAVWLSPAAASCGATAGPALAAGLRCHLAAGTCDQSNPAKRAGDTRSDDPVPFVVGSTGIPDPSANVSFSSTPQTVAAESVPFTPPAYKRFCAYLE